MQYDELYKALADGHRREIVSVLCEQPVVAGDLAKRVGLAPNALSFHLKWLRTAGLIDMQRRGRHLWYHVNNSTLDRWRSHVAGAFNATSLKSSSPPAPPSYAVSPARVTPETTLSPVSYANEALPDELL